MTIYNREYIIYYKGGDKLSKIDMNQAEKLANKFSKEICKKLHKVTSEGCKYDEDCSCLKCAIKFILSEFDVYVKGTKKKK